MNIKKNGIVKRAGKEYKFWTPQEKDLFVQAVRDHGKNYEKIQAAVKTKNRSQC